MPELMLLTDPREEGNQQVSRFPAPDRSCVVAARFLLTLLHQGRPSNWGVRPTRGRANSELHVERRRFDHAQRVEVCSWHFGRVRSTGGECRRSIQERKSADGAEYSACEPARNRDSKDWADGRHDYLSQTIGRRAGDLGQDGALWKGVARGRE